MSSSVQKKGYEAFGSFHTPSIEALFASEIFPLSKIDVGTTSSGKLQLSLSTERNIRRENAKHFLLELNKWTYLNHGAFGATTRFAMKLAEQWRYFVERQPLKFYDRELFPLIVASIKALAKFINVRDPQELVLLPNATSGLHAVLESVLNTSKNHKTTILCFSTRYGAVRKMMDSINSKDGSALAIEELKISLQESMCDKDFLSCLETGLAKVSPGSRALFVVDHITSNTAVISPIKQIVSLCHSKNVAVLVDGAHSLLNLELNLEILNADYYVGNCHKWFCSPKGAAFLHVNSSGGIEQTRTTKIQPRIVSHGYFDGYQSSFMWTGLQDYSPWLSIPGCIAYWEQQNVSDVRHYMHTLIQEATEMLYTKWNMHMELEQCKNLLWDKRHAMRLVKLPPYVFGIEISSSSKNTSAEAKFIQDCLHEKFSIEVPVKCIDNSLYIRLSAHVYNQLEDYEKLADTILRRSTPTASLPL
jgi:selenocysteine lyase/cysteine desulfurase